MNLLVDVVERFVADFTAYGQVDIVTIGESSVSVQTVADNCRSSTTTSTNSASAMIEVALGPFNVSTIKLHTKSVLSYFFFLISNYRRDWTVQENWTDLNLRTEATDSSFTGNSLPLYYRDNRYAGNA